MKEDKNAVLRMHARVSGRVQGVGFRFFVMQHAQDLGLTGWVRNRFDGSVELVVEGNKGQLERLRQRVRRGPRSSNVSEMQVNWESGTGEFLGFQIRLTA